MRPEILNRLFVPPISLPGIGPRLAKLVERVAGPRVVHLLWHLPVGIIDRRYSPTVADAEPGRVATLTVSIDKHQPGAGGGRRSKAPYRVVCSDDSGTLTLVFFHGRSDYLEKLLPQGATRLVSGTLESYGGGMQMTHPDFVGTAEERDVIATVQPVYSLTAGLSGKVMAKAVANGLSRAQDLAEWQDPAFLKKMAWPGWRAALTEVHGPQSLSDLDPGTPARRRLAYDELLASQLTIALVRARMRRRPGRSISGDGSLRARALDAFGFTLTGSQSHALAEILGDMRAPTRMLRLLQGDVGSGKTVVALLAMLNTIEAGGQTALMAPTEVLARQHFATIAPLAEAAGVSAVLLTGRHKGRVREDVLAGLAGGDVGIVVGTHALFQEAVEFKDLALAVVDEQHRFGVHQRLSLTTKGDAVDLLLMTATPIPRTLTLAAYGDLDESRLTEKPPGRQPVDTRTIPLERIEEVLQAVGRALASGTKIYWVCPLIEESEAVDAGAAEDRYVELKTRFGERVGMVHGRLNGKEKDRVMAGFSGDEIDLLVATTVIEVGVDVPKATVMVIEDAERFGLAQLHQLRGRIGRGSDRSTCLLLYATPLGETAKARLKTLRETEDGFEIAEEDLRLRGAGDVLGTRQSGLPGFRLADLSVHADLLAVARDDAQLVLTRDPDLSSERGVALKTLLYLFERDAAVLTARAG